jgi:hypothetical protein
MPLSNGGAFICAATALSGVAFSGQHKKSANGEHDTYQQHELKNVGDRVTRPITGHHVKHRDENEKAKHYVRHVHPEVQHVHPAVLVASGLSALAEHDGADDGRNARQGKERAQHSVLHSQQIGHCDDHERHKDPNQ